VGIAALMQNFSIAIYFPYSKGASSCFCQEFIYVEKMYVLWQVEVECV